MTTTHEVADYLDKLLETEAIPDYSNALNGLQLENSGRLNRIAAAVDFSTRTVRGAIAASATMLVVHHGMFWNGLVRISGPEYQRLRMLIEHDVAVYASHLPLDRHPLYGNNALLAAELGLRPTGTFAEFKSSAIGVSGSTDVDTLDLAHHADSFAQSHGGTARWTHIPSGHRTKQWAICTGAGASSETLQEAAGRGIDTLVVGEGPHHTAIQAEEQGTVVIYAGHYATETLGVRALCSHISDTFGVPWTFIDAPTGL